VLRPDAGVASAAGTGPEWRKKNLEDLTIGNDRVTVHTKPFEIPTVG